MNRPIPSRLNLTTLEDRLTPAMIYALGYDYDLQRNDSDPSFSFLQNQLVRFDSDRPNEILQTLTVTGLPENYSGQLEAIDFRPKTAQLYALGVERISYNAQVAFGGDSGPTSIQSSTLSIFTIDLNTGQATSVATGITAIPDFYTKMTLDFDPVADQIQLVASGNMSLRIDPDNGTILSRSEFQYTPNAANPHDRLTIHEAAYNTNVANTQLYAINDIRLVASPNNDGNFIDVGSHGEIFHPFVRDIRGFDIDAFGNGFVAFYNNPGVFVHMPNPPRAFSTIGTIDLATGTITEMGTIGNLEQVIDITVDPFATGPREPDSLQIFLPQRFVVGSDVGIDSRVRVFGSDRTEVANFSPFPGFTGGTRVAMVDVNGDGVPDIVAATGPGVPNLIRVFDGKDNSLLFEMQPFEESFTGGVFVVAGDVTGDLRDELVVTPDVGGGPRVRIYDMAGSNSPTPQVMADFFGIDDPAFRGGARVAVGDFSGDGTGDLFVAAGAGGGPRIAIYDGAELRRSGTPTKLINDFFMFEETLRNGVNLAVADINGDFFLDVIAGAGPGGAPRVSALDGKSLRSSTQLPIASFYAGNPEDRGGVRIVAKQLDDDFHQELLTAPGNSSTITAYTFGNSGEVSPLFNLDAIPGSDGIFVG